MRVITVIGIALGAATVTYLGRHYIEGIIDAARNKKDELPEKVEGMIEEAVDLAQGTTVEEVKEEIKEEPDSHGEESPAPPSPKKGTAKKK